MNPGDIYYEASRDHETGKVEIDEHVLRTIRGKYGYLVLKASFTWGKRSGKTGDYGWLDPIPAWCRQKFRLESGPPKLYARSKSQALRLALADERQSIAEGFGEATSEKIVKTLEAWIKREMTRKKKAKAARPKRVDPARAAA